MPFHGQLSHDSLYLYSMNIETQAEYTLVHRLAQTVQRRPKQEAIVLKTRRITYEALWADIGAVASFLRANGFKQGDRVGILVENSPEYAAIYYGVLAAGGVVIGLNTTTKARSLLNWLTHSESTWLFASGRHRELATIDEKLGEAINIITLEPPPKPLGHRHDTWQDVVAHKGTAVDLAGVPASDSLAAIIYTSGTTGEPKGVMLSHFNLRSNTESILAYLELCETDSIVNILPFYYSYGNSILHTHLAVGGRLILENSLVYPHKVLETMAAEKVTGFSGVPSTFALLLSRTQLTDYDLSAVRYMTQAGGPMPPANQIRLTEALPHMKMFIMYGQTEASARLSYLPPGKFLEKNGSVGIPIPGVTLDIRNPAGEPVSIGETGEIWARGPNIMMGYWKNPQKTGTVLQDGWLKTGDMARFDEDHYIYIIGRNSEMIKVGANRISPKEIEEVISEIEGIEEAAAVGVDDDILGQVVKAVIVLKKGAELKPQTVQQYCRKHLAQYKIPKFVTFTDNLPKTASGKVRRHLL